MKALDWIFKVGLLVIGVGLVAVCFLASQNDRYKEVSSRDRVVGVLDTRTGVININNNIIFQQ